MKKKICFVIQDSRVAFSFLKNHIEILSMYFDVYLVFNGKNSSSNLLKNLNICEYKEIEIERKINVLKDIKAIFLLTTFFYKKRFFAVHSITPKAGLLTSVSSNLAFIKYKIHTFTGQVWSTKKGWLKYLLKLADRAIVLLNNYIIVDGKNQRRFLIENRIVKRNRSLLLGEGSICGVDQSRFKPSAQIKCDMRKKYNIDTNTTVFGFVGRLNKEKGIEELLCAFKKLYAENTNCYLIIVGNDEEGYVDKFKADEVLIFNKNFLYLEFSINPEEIMQLFDIFCMPSHREGFGMSVIESSCLGIPIICSDIYGLRDAVIDYRTGIFHQAKNANSLYFAMKFLLEHIDVRLELGINGREYVLNKFTAEKISSKWLEFYRNLN